MTGVWPAERHLVAVLLRASGRPRPPVTIAPTDEARWGLVHYLVAAGASALVLPETLLCDPLASIAVEEDLEVWIVPASLAESIRRAAALTTPRACAAMLARLPAIPTFRAQLRRAGPVADRAQLKLL
jgi:hypothetical protein